MPKINMSYDELSVKSDEELVIMADSNDMVLTTLLSRYAKIIWVKANSMSNVLADAEDLAQEGLLGLLNAISCFNINRETKFSTFADVCITNKMKTALVKNKFNATPVEDIAQSIEDVVSENPESIFLQKERLKELYAEITSMLSKREWEIFRLFLKGSSYEETARLTGVSVKSVDNAMQRVRRKLKSVWRADQFTKG